MLPWAEAGQVIVVVPGAELSRADEGHAGALGLVVKREYPLPLLRVA